MALSLSELGINKYEEKVYLALVEEGISTAKSVSDVTGIPYGKVYEVMSSLATKGFLVILPSKPMKYQAVSPKEAVLNTKKAMQDKLEKLEGYIVKELEPAFARTKKYAEPKSVFWLINGRSNVNKKIEELLKKAKENVKISTSENGLKRLVFYRDLLKAATKRGVKVSISGAVTLENLEDVRYLDFCDIKHFDKSVAQFFSIDGHECLVVEPIADDENLICGRDLGIWIASQPFAKFLENFFETHFQNCTNLDNRLLEINGKKNSRKI